MTDTFYAGGNYRVNGKALTNFDRVGQFMRAMGQDVHCRAQFPDDKTMELRYALIDEELTELREAMTNEDLVEIADALGDLLYVIYGAGHAYGIDLDKVFAEIHRSNMTKLGPDGKAIRREDGKVMKPATYTPPNLVPIIYPSPDDLTIDQDPKCTCYEERCDEPTVKVRDENGVVHEIPLSQAPDQSHLPAWWVRLMSWLD